MRRVLDKLPPELADDPDVADLRARSAELPVNLVHLIYRANEWESGARDFEFSARSMAEHWSAGQAAVAQTLAHAQLVAENILDGKTAAFDLARPALSPTR
jgi:NTE family protein